MFVMFVAGLAVVYPLEARQPADRTPSASQAGGNMEGKEVRFGIAASALWGAATTRPPRRRGQRHARQLHAARGLVPLINMQLGEVIFGGVGSGLYGMLIYVDPRRVHRRADGRAHARVPRQEDRGQRGEDGDARHPRPAALHPGSYRDRRRRRAGVASIDDPGPHGLSEMLYAYSSSTGNNGRAFAGFTGNTLCYNLTGGLAMLVGRYCMIVPVLAVAGALARKKAVPASAGTFPTHGSLFVGLLVGVVLIVGGLTFFPALALGPVVEQLAVAAGLTF